MTAPRLLLAIALWGAGPAAAQLVSVSVLAGSEEHRVSGQFGSLHSSGFVPGATIALAAGTRWTFQFTARSGSLTASSGSSDDEEVAEVAVAARAALTEWVGISLVGTTRSVTTDLARQHWSTVAVGADLRLPLIGSATEGYLRFALPLVTKVSGLPTPDVAIEGGAGLRYRLGRLTGQLSYDLRRFDFPPGGGPARLEQLSTLNLGAGVLFGH